jgi:protease-4
VAYFDLSDGLTEKPAGFSLFGAESDSMTLRELVNRIHAARDDKDIKAVLLTVGEHELKLSQAQEIRNALADLGKSGKKTYVYADSYDTVGYTLASGASDVCMLGGGEIMIPGIGMEATFAKGLLDKIGVKADYIQIGEYKGAEEPYTREKASDELRGELNKLIDSLYAQVVEGIARHRNLSADKVKEMIEEAMVTGEAAKERGFVDHLVDVDGLRDLIAKSLGEEKINLLHDYGKPARDSVDFSNPFALFALLARRPEVSTKPAVALIYADGVIVDGQGGESMFGGSGIGSKDMREALRIAARDEKVKAIVIRIDSPGGSALASEAMWQAARRVAKEKPLIISIGSMAASGGYYLASAGEKIYADPTAIVGSIGVVGGKFVTKDLFDKLGINSESFTKGANADLFSSNTPFSDHQRQMVTSWMKTTYEQFTQRVMSTRAGKIKDIDKVARGRIFLAQQAKELGMVDEIGGIDDAITFAADKGGMKEGEYDVRILPVPKTLADYFGGGSDAKFPIRQQMSLAEDSILRALAPATRKLIGEEIQMIQLLQDRPVMLVSPYRVTVR